METIEELLKVHGKKVFSMCLRITKNQADAEDLYQETFLQVLKMMNRPDFQENPLPFILQCCIWKGKSQQRRFARRQRIAPVTSTGELFYPEEKESCAEMAETAELYACIRREVERLPETYKMPVLLFYNAELSVEETGKVLNCPAGTVKSRLHRAKQILKQRLEENGYEGF